MIHGFTGRLLSPGVSVMSRINYAGKFTLLWVVSFVAICVSITGLYSSLDRTITLSRRQLDGIPLIRSISEVTRVVQQHRGLSFALLSGNQSVHQRLALKDIEVSEAIDSLLSATSASGIGENDRLRRINSEWNKLSKAGLHLSAADSFAAHTRLVNDILILMESVSDEYLMTVDPDISTSYLFGVAVKKLPHVLEHFGQIRAYGAGVLIKKRVSEVDRVELKTMLAEFDREVGFLKMSLEKVDRLVPEGSLMQTTERIEASARWVAGVVVADMLSGQFVVTPGEFYDLSTREIDGGYARLHDYLLPALISMVNDRISRAQMVMFAVVGGVALLFLLMVYLSVCIYYVLTGCIVPLRDAFSRFSDGNLNARVDVKTSDEMKVVGDKFNDMAGKFEVLMKERMDAEDHLRAIIGGAMDAVVCIGSDRRIVGWSGQAERIFGRSEDDVSGKLFCEVVIIPREIEDGWRADSDVPTSYFEAEGLRCNGERFPVEISVAQIKGVNGCVFSAFIRDITLKKASDEIVWRQANFDILTGLPNRCMFHNRLDFEIGRSRRTGLKLALLFLDLDKFKEVNDTLGHGMGDILLHDVARRIEGVVRETDTVARLGGDEFTIILSGVDDAGFVDRIASEVLRSIDAPFLLNRDVAHVSASIGITMYPDDAANADDLIRNADQAMYAAKNGGRNGFRYFASL